MRFFESGGTNRGAYIDLTSTTAGVGTDLLSPGSATDTTARTTASAAFDKANAANVIASSAFGIANAAFGFANGVSTNTTAAFAFANGVSTNTTAAFGFANGVSTNTTAAFAFANGVSTNTTAAFAFANGVSTNTTAAFGFANGVSTNTTAAFAQANSANNRSVNTANAYTWTNVHTFANGTSSVSPNTGSVILYAGAGVAGNVYVGNVIGWANNTSNVSAVYTYYNKTTNSLDTVFG